MIVTPLPPVATVARAFNKIAVVQTWTSADKSPAHRESGHTAVYSMDTTDGLWAVKPLSHWGAYRTSEREKQYLWHASNLRFAAKAKGVSVPEPLVSRQGLPFVVVLDDKVLKVSELDDPANDHAIVFLADRLMDHEPWRFTNPVVAGRAGYSLGRNVSSIPWRVGGSVTNQSSTRVADDFGVARSAVEEIYGVVWPNVIPENILWNGDATSLIDSVNSDPNDPEREWSNVEINALETWDAFATNEYGVGEVRFGPDCEAAFICGYATGYLDVVPQSHRGRFVDLFARYALERLGRARDLEAMDAAGEVVDALEKAAPHGMDFLALDPGRVIE